MQTFIYMFRKSHCAKQEINFFLKNLKNIAACEIKSIKSFLYIRVIVLYNNTNQNSFQMKFQWKTDSREQSDFSNVHLYIFH